MKRCTKCGVEKPVTEFYKQKSIKKDGLAPSCKSCKRASHSKWVAENRDRNNATARKRYRADPSKSARASAKWYKNNTEKAKDSRARYYRANVALFNEKTMRYNAKKKDQTPDMNKAELVEIEAMYMYNQIMPGDWEVDHIEAIANGGLHHPSNLQVLSRHENRSKGARL